MSILLPGVHEQLSKLTGKQRRKGHSRHDYPTLGLRTMIQTDEVKRELMLRPRELPLA